MVGSRELLPNRCADPNQIGTLTSTLPSYNPHRMPTNQPRFNQTNHRELFASGKCLPWLITLQPPPVRLGMDFSAGQPGNMCIRACNTDRRPTGGPQSRTPTRERFAKICAVNPGVKVNNSKSTHLLDVLLCELAPLLQRHLVFTGQVSHVYF